MHLSIPSPRIADTVFHEKQTLAILFLESKHDLFQINDEWLKKLPAELLLEVSKRLLHDVKELQDRLNQNPGNSSRPPTSQPPWAKTGGSEERSGAADERGTADVAAETAGSSTEETEQAAPADGR